MAVFDAGEDAAAKRAIAGPIVDSGFEPVDVGGWAEGRIMEAPRRPGAVDGEVYRSEAARATAKAVPRHPTEARPLACETHVDGSSVARRSPATTPPWPPCSIGRVPVLPNRLMHLPLVRGILNARTPGSARANEIESWITEMRGFYWLIDGVLAGCARPGARRRGEAADTAGALAALDEDLAALKAEGIGAVLSLTETPLVEGALTRHGLEGLHIPVDDLRAPTPEQLRSALAFIDRQRALGRQVAVHCLVGQGRTGTVLAAYLIRGGLDAAAALREVRSVCPGAVGSPEQERALEAYAARDWFV